MKKNSIEKSKKVTLIKNNVEDVISLKDENGSLSYITVLFC